jgi:3-hydroxyisobutyrate dehydrogenase
MTGAAIAPPSAVAFLGLGKMGAPMAARLVAAEWQVRAYDLSPGALDAFLRANPRALRAERPTDAVADAEVVITMLPDGAAVRRAVLDTGLAPAMPKGTLVVDMSSSAPAETLELGKALEGMGLGLVDAPVSGGVKRATKGDLAVMIGGEPERVRWCRPLVATLGSAIYETGPLGSGHAMKALNNFVSAAGLVATCEALLAGKRFGLDPALMVDILNASSGCNNTTLLKAKQFMLSGSFDSGFSLGLMTKDLRTAAGIAEELRLEAPLSGAMADLWTKAQEALEPDADHTEMFRFLEALPTRPS